MADGTSGTPAGDWRPVPDPTELTTEAVALATAQFRRELGALREILETRFTADDEQRALLWAQVNGWSDQLELRLERRRREGADAITGLRAIIEQRLDGSDRAIELAATEIAKIREQNAAADRLLAEDTAARMAAEREFILSQIAGGSAETRRVGDVAQEKFAAIEGTFASNALALTAALAAQKEAAAEQNKSNTLAISKSEQATKETIAANAAQTTAGLSSQAATIADLKDRVVRIESMGVGSAARRTDARLDLGTILAAVAIVVSVAAVLVLAFKK
jgi:hypothetical protein